MCTDNAPQERHVPRNGELLVEAALDEVSGRDGQEAVKLGAVAVGFRDVDEHDGHAGHPCSAHLQVSTTVDASGGSVHSSMSNSEMLAQ